MTIVRVLIVDDHASVREGLRRSLEAHGLDVVGEAGNGSLALHLAAKLLPDVVLMDVSLPEMDGVEATRRLLDLHPQIQVVILTMFDDYPTVSAAIQAGATGYLVKDCTTAEIVAVINGLTSDDPTLSSKLAATMLQAVGRSTHSLVSARELEVLQLACEGASTAEVAAKLYISTKTVKNHFANIYQKLEATDRTQAVLKALRMGIIRLR